MLSNGGVCLRKLAGRRSREVQFGRWLANPRVTPAKVIEPALRRTGQLAAGRHVLAIQDTTEINYQAHAKRVRGLGTVGNGVDAGLFLHPLLALDAADGSCLGLAHVHHWNRDRQATPSARKLRIEDKESFRWLDTAQAGKQVLSQAAQITIIADRESDIYEEWARLPDARTHLLTRACHDRRLAPTSLDTESAKLYPWLAGLPVQGSYSFNVPARPGKRSAHTARLEIRFGRTAIQRPASCTDKHAPSHIELYAIEVKELPESVVGKERPIHWRLLTTHAIASVEDALQCVGWYRQRWHIEQLFRTLKRQGLNIESSQVETADGLVKLIHLAIQVAVRTMQLTLAREGAGTAQAADVFEPHELEVLRQLKPTLEGKTLKQKNPHPDGSLAQAAWVIARLGGWKGYASEAKPGPITMHDGLRQLAAMCAGWRLAWKNVCID